MKKLTKLFVFNISLLTITTPVISASQEQCCEYLNQTECANPAGSSDYYVGNGCTNPCYWITSTNSCSSTEPSSSTVSNAKQSKP